MKKTAFSVLAFCAAVTFAAPAHADLAGHDDSDELFARGLDYGGVLYSFPLQKRQGQRYCKDVMDGDTPLDAVYRLMRDGAYSFDVANAISSSAMVAYCENAVIAAQGIPASPTLARPFEIAYKNGSV